VLTEVTVDRLRKLDMVQHCKWIAYGTDGVEGKGCTRMRRSCTCLFLLASGHAFRVPRRHWCQGFSQYTNLVRNDSVDSGFTITAPGGVSAPGTALGFRRPRTTVSWHS
jgi:hypothetical protein